MLREAPSEDRDQEERIDWKTAPLPEEPVDLAVFGPTLDRADFVTTHERLQALSFLPFSHLEVTQANALQGHMRTPGHPASMVPRYLQTIFKNAEFTFKKNYESEKARREALRERAEGIQGPLYTVIFPPEKFDGFGNRRKKDPKYDDWKELTDDEKKRLGREAGKRALISVAFEYGEHYENAKLRHEKLLELEKLIQASDNPNILAAEAEVGGPNNPALIMIIHYLDLVELMKNGYTMLGLAFDPLAGSVDRTPEEIDGEIKNKKVIDSYTRDDINDYVKAHLIRCLDELSVGDVRGILSSTIANEHARGLFWLQALRETCGHGSARIAAERILAKNNKKIKP